MHDSDWYERYKGYFDSSDFADYESANEGEDGADLNSPVYRGRNAMILALEMMNDLWGEEEDL